MSGKTDETFFASVSASRQVGQNGSFGTSVYGNYYLPALAADGKASPDEVQAAIAGKVVAIHVAKGDRVTPGEILIEIEG